MNIIRFYLGHRVLFISGGRVNLHFGQNQFFFTRKPVGLGGARLKKFICCLCLHVNEFMGSCLEHYGYGK